MDTIELKKFQTTGRLVDEITTRPKGVLNKIKNTFSKAVLTKDGLYRRPTEYYEFFINDQPLSLILTEFCNLDNSIPDNWIGVFGSFSNRQTELNKIKRLQLKQITEQEIRAVFPKDIDKQSLDNGIENYLKELADEQIIIYGCAECGDYGCNGYKVKVDKIDDSIVWTYFENGKILQFHFDKNQYFKAFDN